MKRKYQTILLSIALFLTFDLGVLVPNFILSSSLRQDAIAINLAGRQRMLSQRMVKALLQLQVALQAGKPTTTAQQELELSHRLFQQTLDGFDRGGMVTGGNGQPVALTAMQTEATRDLVQQAIALWRPYEQRIIPLLQAQGNLAPQDLQAAIDQALDKNLRLLDLMNRLTFELEQTANHKANTLQLIQVAGLLLALANFFVLAFHSLKRFQRNDQELERSEQQMRAQTEQLQQTLAELQRAQANLIQTEKMSSLGRLVAGVTHELNNPVNFIQGNLIYTGQYIKDLLKILHRYELELANPSPELQRLQEEIDIDFLAMDLPKLLVSMQVGVDRIETIILSLRNFSRLDESALKAVDIHQGLDSALLILEHGLSSLPQSKKIQVVKHYGPLPLVECYAGHLNQVFMNILSNAIDALAEQGKQAGGGGGSLAAAPTIRITTEARSDQVVIRIADNGPGMSAAIRQRIFDPFFTTKPVGEGTGMGLSICYQVVVEKHHGRLSCQSELGEGTEFVIELPVSQSL